MISAQRVPLRCPIRMNMRRNPALAFLVCVMPMINGCNKGVSSTKSMDRSSIDAMGLSPYSARLREGAGIGGGGGGGGELTVYAAESRRFVAIKHSLEVIAGEQNLQKAWQAVIDYCGTLSCEVVSSSITTKTPQIMPSGRIALRVVPDDLKKVLAYVETQGTVAEHSTESEDKTGIVLDTEAKIKNLTAFRDNLRAMLSRSSVTVKDAIEIQERLTTVQSQLDSETAGRKVLANETEKVAVDISFRVDLPLTGGSGFNKILSALRESGSVLAESTAWLILAVMTFLPWLIVIVPLGWLVVRWVRRWKKSHV